ncbi:MAG: ATP-dependent sacrificial sulfur transferase LarE, partial [Candidatus Bathyarchaeia archaeon]
LAFAHQYQLPLRVIDLHEIEDPNYKQNSPNRCYFCKLHLFSQIVPLANSLGFFYVADGANVEDLGDFRPGLQAAKKYHIHHPLIEAGLSKSDIRLIAKNMNLPIWNKPSMACLASRFPYGEEISLEKLLRVAKAESYLRSLGFNEFRVRSHGNLARLEMGEKDQEKAFLLRNSIAQELKNIGFLWVCLDCLPFQSGSMNLMLSYLNHHELSKPSKS